MSLQKTINTIILLVLVSAVTSCKKDEVVTPPESTNNRWERIANFGGQAVRGAASFSIGTNAYVVSGIAGSQLLNQVYQYNSLTNTWIAKNNFPGSYRLDFNGFSIGNKGYVCLGSDNQKMLSDIWEYDPQTDSWTKKTDFPGGPRYSSTVIVIGQKAYVIAGSPSYPSVHQKDVWEFDPQFDRWTKMRDFPGEARSLGVGFAIGNKGYLGTGVIAGTGYTAVKDFWEYDQPTDTWTRKTDLPGSARGYAQGFTIGSKGYIALGVTGINASGTVLTVTNDIWEFDPQNNSWSQKTNFPGLGRAMSVSFVIGSYGYVGLGSNANTQDINDLWKFIP